VEYRNGATVTKYQLWVSERSQTFFLAGSEQPLQFAREDEAVLTWEVEAESYNEAMTLYYEHMGWDPYVPMDD
jgi:hypothetical protein